MNKAEYVRRIKAGARVEPTEESSYFKVPKAPRPVMTSTPLDAATVHKADPEEPAQKRECPDPEMSTSFGSASGEHTQQRPTRLSFSTSPTGREATMTDIKELMGAYNREIENER